MDLFRQYRIAATIDDGQGHKIEAIRGYRLLHSVDLKTAKEAIESRQRTMLGGQP